MPAGLKLHLQLGKVRWLNLAGIKSAAHTLFNALEGLLRGEQVTRNGARSSSSLPGLYLCDDK